MKVKIQHTEIYGMQQTTTKMEVYSNTALSQETRKISNKQSNLTPKGTRKRRASEALN